MSNNPALLERFFSPILRAVLHGVNEMALSFSVVQKGSRAPSGKPNSVQLLSGNWDDYSYKTSFQVTVYDPKGVPFSLGTVKIGYRGQEHGWTFEYIEKNFESLPDGWFSLGQDVDYYLTLRDKLGAAWTEEYLRAMRDIVADEKILSSDKQEEVLRHSLMRGVSVSVIHGQYRRVLSGSPVLTQFKFEYRDPGDEKRAAIKVRFKVNPGSKPSTNVHVLIGRNGVGKTTVLNNMVGAILEQELPTRAGGNFYVNDEWEDEKILPSDYFSSVVSVSFSAFDPFIPPVDQPNRSLGVAYFYIGMKHSRSGISSNDPSPKPPKTDKELADDFLKSLASCLSQPAKRERWRSAIERLESDANFADMALGRLLEVDNKVAMRKARELVKLMSSGHAIVLLTMTKLVDTVEEKTLVLLDEPESHLHPPLLSAFTRALSDLLHDRNGVAIVATHSPVVAQEVPRSCVWKLTRIRAQGRADRPERETFGENVGVLTREIFGLEVSKSGFHDLLRKAVEEGGSFESIFADFNEELGFEAQAILQSLILARDSARPTQQ